MATYPAAPPMQNKFVTVALDDVSTAGSAWVVPGFRGKIKKIHSVIDGAIATANAVVTAKIGGTAVTNGVVTIATASSAAGDIDTATPSAANAFSPGQAIELATNGASTNTVKAVFTLELEPT